MKTAAALALAFFSLALVSAPATAANAAAVGTWDMVAETPNGPMPSVLVLKKVEGKLKAEVDLAGMKREVSEESLQGDVLKMKVMYDSVLYAIQTKITGNTMEGTWDGGGNSGTLKATRRP
jgi:Skp family chaperone for outer membrane proteins